MSARRTIENTMDIKAMNVNKVIDSFLKLGRSTRADIARDSGLSISTCNTIIRELLERGEIAECEMVKAVGRPSHTYVYNSDRALALCITIVSNSGINAINYALVNLEGKIVESNQFIKKEITLEEFYVIIDNVLTKNNIDAIGIGIPGMTYKGAIEYCDVESLEGIQLQSVLEEKYGIKVIVENEMHLKAYGYYKNHPEFGNEIIAVLNLPEGHTWGAGFVIDGQVLEGFTNFSGEINYLPFVSSREELIKQCSNKETMIPLIVKIVITILTIINPARLIFVGEGFDDEIVTEVKEKVNIAMPNSYLPKYYFQKDISKEYIDGIVLFTQNTIR